MQADAVAAIDCGTNSTRLLVADGAGRPLERLMTITRLGRGVDRTKRLEPEAIDRTVTVLQRYRRVMDRHGVGPVRMTATSAARDAANRADFFAAATAAAGVAPELLSGEDEAALSFAGATSDLRPDLPADLRPDLHADPGAPAPTSGTGTVGVRYLVADIGGGSTELAAGPLGTEGPARLVPVAVRSLDIGCVRITERFLHSDPPTPAQLRSATDEVERLLVGATTRQPDLAGAGQLIGLAGTVAALAALDQGLETYDRAALHHHRLSRQAVDDLLGALAAEPAEARSARPGMEAARADVIVGGAIVLSALLRHLRLDGCLTSEADILDGLVMSLLVEDH